MQVTGAILHLGDDISTDVIYPARYMGERDRLKQAAFAMEGMPIDVREALPRSAIISAGWNMGCGSSREQAVTALAGAGVRLVVARSFGRLYFRNCINTGLAAIESPGLAQFLAGVSEAEIDITTGLAHAANQVFRFEPLPEMLRDIVEAGGLLAQLNGRRL